MKPKFTKYKKLIALQLEELTADNALGQSAQKTVELSSRLEGFHAWTHCNPKLWHKHSRDEGMPSRDHLK